MHAEQCVSPGELEEVRFRLHSELIDSKKETKSVNNDLQYWKNETLSILKTYLLSKG